MNAMRVFLAACAALIFAASSASGAEYPDRPVTIVVGYNAGGGTDIVARTIAEALSKRWGHRVLVENRPGAQGSIGVRTLKTAAPDGYTLGVWSTSDVGNAAMQDKLGYDLVQDFEHVSQLASGATVLVVKSALPVQDFPQYVEYATKNKGALNVAVVSGGDLHLDTVRINRAAKIETAIIGYPGTAPGLTDVVAGHSDAILLPLAPASPHIKSGAIRAIAVGSTKRWAALPEVKTFSETIPGLESTFFYGMVAPKGTPQEIVAKINASVREALAEPELEKKFETIGFVSGASSPEEFKATVAKKLEISSQIAQEAGMKRH